MNEKDFYKQLMSEYSFDHEKIKKAAMGKIIEPEKKKSPIKWISATCAAAAIALTVGTVAIMAPGNPVSVTPTNSVSVEDRFKLALEAYEKADLNTEEEFLYVTFMDKETPTDMQNILARADATGEIKVIEVYLTDRSIISGNANIKELFSLDEENIAAVKIRCPGNFIKRLTDDRDVYLVETDKPFENGEFSAIDTNVSNPAPPETSTEGTENSTPDEESSSSTEQTSPPPVIGDTTPPEEVEPNEQPGQPETVVTTPVAEITEAPATEATQAPVTEEQVSEVQTSITE